MGKVSSPTDVFKPGFRRVESFVCAVTLSDVTRPIAEAGLSIETTAIVDKASLSK